MNRFFSFQRMITASFVRGLYFLGFVCLTGGGVAVIIWTGLQLNNRTIDRALGWRYVIYGAAVLILGNLVWRVFCELWIVLFNIHDHLSSIDDNLSIEAADEVTAPVTTATERASMPRERLMIESSPRAASILGLP